MGARNEENLSPAFFDKRETMKINDPFGRLERKHQAGYEAMRDSLHKAGVRTESAALELMQASEQRIMKFGAIALAVAVLLAFAFSTYATIVICAAMFLVAWLFSFTVNGRRYIKRYIEEELKNGGNRPEQKQDGNGVEH